MKKTLMFGSAVVAAVFAAGYVIGQFHSPPTSSAANATKSLAVGKYTATGRPERWTQRFDGPRAFGQVKAVSGPNNNTVTIKPFVGRHGLEFSPTTIILTSNTKYYAGRRATTTASAVKVGAYIAAKGTLSANKKSLTAAVVMVLPREPKRLGMREHPGLMTRFGGPGAFGKVTAIAGNSVSLKPVVFGWRTPSQVTTIVLTDSTKLFSGPFSPTTRTSLKVGGFVAAQGTLSTDGKTLTASRLLVLPSELGRHRFMWHHAGDMPSHGVPDANL